MTDDIKPEVIKKTQEVLGKFIKKPVLTDKLLTKPPFRFLHDICTAAMRETGFFEGVLDTADCKIENIKDKDGKIAFLQKMIAALETANGIKLTVKPSKIVAGHEPQRTNELLQALGKALEKQMARNGDVTKSKPEAKEKAKAKSVKRSEKEEPASKKKTTTVRSSKTEKPENKGHEDPKKKSTGEKTSRSKQEGVKKSEISPRVSENGVEKQTRESSVEEEKRSKHREKTKLKTSQAPSHDSSEVLTESKPKPKEEREHSIEKAQDPVEQFESKRPVSAKPGHRKPAETAEPSHLAESSPIQESEPSEPPKVETVVKTPVETPPKRPESGFLRHTKQSSVNGIPSNYPTKDSDSVEDSSPISRPLTGIRPATGRPASARPAAPRIRDRGEISVHEDVVKQTMGNVQIITDKKQGNEPEEDDNVVVVEPENELLPDELDRSDQLDSVNNQSVDQEEHGLLVEQILETQKELDQSRLQIVDGKPPGKTEIEWKSTRNREATDREIKKLRLLIQTVTRSANPLGKLLDLLQEDVDIMQKELTNWKEMNANLDVQIAQEQSLTEQSVEPLKAHLKEIQQSIDQQLEQITFVKANILRNDQKIYKLLTEMK